MGMAVAASKHVRQHAEVHGEHHLAEMEQERAILSTAREAGNAVRGCTRGCASCPESFSAVATCHLTRSGSALRIEWILAACASARCGSESAKTWSGLA